MPRSRSRSRARNPSRPRGRNVMCRECNRMFATRNALTQHVSDVHRQSRSRQRSRATAPRRRNQLSRRRNNATYLDPRTETALPNINERFTGFNGMGMPTGCTDSTPSRMISSILPRSLGTTELGHNWAQRALHPCDDARAGGVAIPDAEQAEVAHIEARLDEVLGPVHTDAGTDPYDMQVLVLPTLDLPLVYRTRNAKTHADPTKGWTTWRSVGSVGANMTAGEMQWREEGGLPVILTRPGLTSTATAFRQTFKGVTLTMNASALTNQGIVTSGQWVDALEVIEVPLQGSGPRNVDSITKVITVTDVPYTTSGIIQKVPNAGQWEARKGCYMPLRFAQDTHLYTHDESSEFPTSEIGVRVDPAGLPVLIKDGTDSGITLGQGLVIGPTEAPETLHSVATSAGVINQQVGIIHFSGVDTNASFVCKLREGASVEPQAGNPLTSVVGRPAPEDQVAIKNVTNIARQLPLSYEAKYNSLGLLLPLIAKAASFVLPSVMPWIYNRLNAYSRRPLPRPVNTAQYIQEEVD